MSVAEDIAFVGQFVQGRNCWGRVTILHANPGARRAGEVTPLILPASGTMCIFDGTSRVLQLGICPR